MGGCCSKKVPPTLLDVPLDITYLIFKYLEPKDLLRSRKVCRGLRTAVDEYGIRFDGIVFAISDNYIEMEMGRNELFYTNVLNGGTTVTYRERQKRFETGNFVEIALNDLKAVLKHVSIFFIVNQIENRNDDFTSFCETLKSIGPIHAKKTIIVNFSFEHVLSILPYFDAKTLKNIELEKTNQVDQFERITHLDQWKNAKQFKFFNAEHGSEHIEHCFHFEEFTIQTDKFSVQNAVQIRDELMKRSTFREREIYLNNSSDPIEYAKVFKPDYAGGREYNFEYSNNNNIKFSIGSRGAWFSVSKKDRI